MSARLRAVYERVTSWQRRTFPHQTAASILAHMRLELKEIEAAPYDIEERADMAILAMGAFDRLGIDPGFEAGADDLWLWGRCDRWAAAGALRALVGEFERRSLLLFLREVLCRCSLGVPSLDSEEKFLDAIEAKMNKNEARRWPAPTDQVSGQPVEHIREEHHVSGAVEALRSRVAELEAQRDDGWGAFYNLASTAGEQADAIAKLTEERAEWRADNERLRAERNKIRMWLQAAPNEGAIEAVHRLIRETNAARNREGGQ